MGVNQATRHDLTIVILIVAIFAWTGPFGTYGDMSPAWRMLYWAVAIPGCGLPFRLALNHVRGDVMAHPIELRRFFAWFAVAALPATGVVLAVEVLVRGTNVRPAGLPWLLLSVYALGLVFGATRIVAGRLRRPSRPSTGAEAAGNTTMTEPADERSRCPFMARLAPELGADLVSLSMQDHYVEATTAMGRQLIHLRFGEALGEVAQLDGLRIHRSHWVARAHLRDVRREEGRSVAVLDDGRLLPVSAPYLAEARAMAPPRGVRLRSDELVTS